MVDRLTSEQRSEVMRRVRQKNTGPEMVLRQVLHALGYRFRLHRRDLPGTPDVVLPRYRVAIFVHGCFWHRHVGCKLATVPSSNCEYWVAKFRANVTRDADKEAALTKAGWRVLTVWECETRDPSLLSLRLRRLLDDSNLP